MAENGVHAVNAFESTPQEVAYKQSVLKAMREYREEEGLEGWGRLAEKSSGVCSIQAGFRILSGSR